MIDAENLAFLRIPFEVLAALDWRPYHFAVQPLHHLLRLAHVVSASAFFGGVALLDLRLTGVRGTVPLRSFAQHTLPWLHAVFAVAVVSGLGLFLYRPVQVGSHAYFVPKLLLMALGMVNVLAFHRLGYGAALAAEARMPPHARFAGAVSLAAWLGVMVCASLNVESAPKLLLR